MSVRRYMPYMVLTPLLLVALVLAFQISPWLGLVLTSVAAGSIARIINDP